MRPRDLVGTTYLTALLPAALAADASAFTAEIPVPFRCKVVSVDFTPTAAVTGTDTNSRTVNVFLSDGTTNIANIAFVATPATNAAIHTATALTVTGTAAQLKLAANAVLAIQSAKVGTGLALPQGTIRVGVQSA